jgi:hypothetical protein
MFYLCLSLSGSFCHSSYPSFLSFFLSFIDKYWVVSSFGSSESQQNLTQGGGYQVSGMNKPGISSDSKRMHILQLPNYFGLFVNIFHIH